MCIADWFGWFGSCCDPSSDLLLAMVAPTSWKAYCARLLLTGDQFFDFPVAFDVEKQYRQSMSIFSDGFVRLVLLGGFGRLCSGLNPYWIHLAMPLTWLLWACP